jgi:hypothetical protein
MTQATIGLQEMEMEGRDEFETNPMATKLRRNQSKQRASKP